jgi:hypothetical protein
MCGIIPGETHIMRLPHFLSVKRIQKLSEQDEKVFTDARELALLRLEQCIADLRNPVPPIRNASRSHGHLTTEKTHEFLRASSGRLMRVTFSDGVVQTVIIGTVDKAGFLHRGIDAADPQVFWTRFEDVDTLEAEN